MAAPMGLNFALAMTGAILLKCPEFLLFILVKKSFSAHGKRLFLR
jgi:hypothetical protein